MNRNPTYYLLFTGLLAWLFICIPARAWTQNTAHLSLSNDSILIGDQVKLKLSARLDHNAASILFPAIPDTFSRIEVLEKGKIDTIRNKEYNIYQKEILITCFDSGSYNFPLWHIQFVDGSGTMQSLPLTSTTLYVNTIPEVDTTLPIKPIYEIEPEEAPDFMTKVREIYERNKTAAWIIVVVLLLFILSFLFYRFYWRNRKRQPGKSTELPFVRAKRLVTELEQSGLWQQQQYKAYYSQLSEVLKNYFEEQFGINANEMTTRDFLHLLKRNNDWRRIHGEMRQILQIADITKFAKGLPGEEDHVLSVRNAIKIIEQTRPQVLTENDQ